FGGGQNLPKGDINQLWRLLGVRMLGDQGVLQDYNPYAQFYLPPNYVVIDDEGLSGEVAHPFNDDDEITSGLNQVLFINTGSVRKADDARHKVESLVVTGKMTAT